MYKKINYLYGVLLFFVLLLFVHFFNLRKFYTSDSADFDSAIFEPSLYISLGLIANALLLMFFNQVIFDKWFKKIFLWFAPLGLIITFTTDVYGGIPQPGRGDVAALLSGLLVFITLLFTFIQKFYYQIK